MPMVAEEIPLSRMGRVGEKWFNTAILEIGVGPVRGIHESNAWGEVAQLHCGVSEDAQLRIRTEADGGQRFTRRIRRGHGMRQGCEQDGGKQ